MRNSVGLIAARALFTHTANATLITTDLAIPGDALLTRDTQTGLDWLDWLDLTATVGQSPASVLSGPFAAQGFRYASDAEVIQLWEDAGAVGSFENNHGGNYSVSNFVPAQLLISLMGCTSQLVGEPCDGMNQNWNIGFFESTPIDAAIVDYFGPPDRDRNGLAAM